MNSVITFAKQQKIWNILKSDPDILIMTDTRVGEYDLNQYGGNKRKVISTNTDYRGVAIIIKSSFEPENIEIDNETGNLVAITFVLAGKLHGLIGIYGPCDDNPNFYNFKVQETIKKLKEAKVKVIIIAGDLNIQLGKMIGYKETNSRKKLALQKLCKTYEIFDHVSLLTSTTNTRPMSFWRKKTLRKGNPQQIKNSKQAA